MISKELLSEVLKQDIYELSVVFDVIEYKLTQFKYISSNTVNIYELAHKCKEWLENNTHWDVMIIGYEVYLMEDIWGESGARTHKRFTTEREWYLNLFKAAQYILEQKGIK